MYGLLLYKKKRKKKSSFQTFFNSRISNFLVRPYIKIHCISLKIYLLRQNIHKKHPWLHKYAHFLFHFSFQFHLFMTFNISIHSVCKYMFIFPHTHPPPVLRSFDTFADNGRIFCIPFSSCKKRLKATITWKYFFLLTFCR